MRSFNKLIFNKELQHAFLVLASYLIAAQAGLKLATINHNVSPVWPATGVAIGSLLLFGRQQTWVIFLGAFIANWLTGTGIITTSAIALGNSLEAWMGAYIFARLLSHKNHYEYQAEVIATCGASFAGAFLSASVGTTALWASEIVPTNGFSEAWSTWWIGDALGGIMMIPLLQLVSERDKQTPFISLKFFLSLLIVTATTLAASYFVFFHPQGSPLLFLVLPCLLLTAWIAGTKILPYTTLLIAACALVGTLKNHGPFTGSNTNDNLLHLQLFFFAVGLTGLALGGFVRAKILKFPSFILLLCWMIAGALFYSFETREVEKDSTRFIEMAEDVHTDVLTRIKVYEEAVRAGVSLFNASDVVHMNEWAQFIRSMDIENRFPGMQGIGVLWPVPRSELKSFVKKMRQTENPQFTVQRLPENYPSDIHYLIKFIEPVQENTSALGFDLSTEPKRKLAAELARDSGKSAITPMITLVQDPKKRPGFLLFMPIYKNNVPVDTIENRRSAFQGWIYGAFVNEKLYEGILGKNRLELDLTVYEGHVSPDNVIFHSGEAADTTSVHFTYLDFGQHKLTLAWKKGPQFPTTYDGVVAWVGLCGAIISLFLAFIVVNLQLINVKSVEIAERLTAEKNAALAWQKALLDSANYCIVSIDTAGIIQSFNAGAEKMLGYKAEELVGRPDPKNIYDMEEVIQRARELSEELGRTIEPGIDVFTAKVQQGLPAEEREWTYIRKDGTRFPALLTVTALKDKDGSITGYVGFATDISEKKKAQELLEISNNRLARVIKATNVGIWERDLINAEVYLDETCRELMGIAKDEIPDREILLSQYDSTDVQKMALQVQEHIENHTPNFDCEGRFRRLSDNQPRWLKAMGYAVKNKAGKAIKLLSTVSDITERKVAEESLHIALDKAQAATMAKSAFLANVSHEIRTPLNGILGMTELLLDTPLTVEQKRYAGIVQQSGNTLLSLINDVLDFSKIEAGKLSLESVEFSLSQLVEGQAEVLIAKARQKNLSLTTFISPDLPSAVEGDPARISQILVNLMGNAIKFTEKGGISVRVLQSGKPFNDRIRIRFEITDSGIGISPEHQSKLFQPFVQGHSQITQKYGGTGLGLSISKRLVDAMDGQISFESSSAGTTFWFEIPLKLSRLDASDIADRLTGASVLIVEPEPISLKALESYFDSWKIRSASTQDGSKAVELLEEAREKNSPFEIVLLGAQAPLQRTQKLLSSIHQTFPQDAPRIIILTDFGKSPDPQLVNGNRIFLPKPIKQSELFDAIATCLGKEAIQTPKAESTPKIQSQISSGDFKILIADDVSANQMLTQRLLEKLGYSAHIVANGKEVLEAMTRVEYDLILMDCQMPEMDGYEATRQIRTLEKKTGKHIPVVALTANAMSGDAKKCLEAGMDDYLSKPIRREQLAQMVKKLLTQAQIKRTA